MGDRLATIDMGRKLGEGCAPFFGRAAGSPSKTMAWADAYLRTKGHLYQFSYLATTDMGRKLGTLPFFFGGGELGPHL